MSKNVISCQTHLINFAKKLRRVMIYSEVTLWNKLKKAQLMNYDFVKLRAIGKYIVDFYCKDLKLAIEVDGETHLEEGAKERDRLRQNELQSLGVHFLRFDALYVLKDLEFVIKEIGNWIQEYEMKFGISEKIANRRSAESRPPDASGGKFTFTLHQPIIR